MQKKETNKTRTEYKATRKIAWFSCGAASAVASKLALDSWHIEQDTDEFEIVYIYLKNEHKDSERFLKDCERWFNYPIKIIRDKKYNADVDRVIASSRYMAGVYGATCTKELKKKVRYDYQRENDTHVFGMTIDEEHRLNRLIDTEPNMFFESPLIDLKYTKNKCFEIVNNAKIELPAMYKLGYKNNNCIGCLKAGSVSYWNKIREDFPAVFKKRAGQEKALGVAMCKMALHKFERLYKKEHDVMKADASKGLVKWIVDSYGSLRIPLRYLPICEIKQAELDIGNCGFFCESK